MIGFKSILSILLLLVITNGCVTNKQSIAWKNPDTPITRKVEFVPMNDGLYLDKTSSENLLKNVEDMDAYTEKLETLVEHMKEYYGAK